MALTQSDHNDIVDRASIIVWLGIFTVVIILLYSVALILFFPLTGTTFILTIVVEIVMLIVAVFAIWFATSSLFAVNAFRLVVLLAALVTFVIFVVQFVFFIQALIGDASGTTVVASVLIDLFRQTFQFLIFLLFFGLAVSMYVTGTHYSTALERKGFIDSENDAAAIAAALGVVTVTTTPGASIDDIELYDTETPTTIVSSSTTTTSATRRRTDRAHPHISSLRG